MPPIIHIDMANIEDVMAFELSNETLPINSASMDLVINDGIVVVWDTDHNTPIPFHDFRTHFASVTNAVLQWT